MSATPPSSISPRVHPTHERAVRAIKALDEGRWLDARKNADAMPDAPVAELAWKRYLHGRVHLALNELKSAEVALERAAALAMEWGGVSASSGRQPGGDNLADALRLSADALEHLGRVHRRGERGDRAIRAHQSAYALRREHGSPLEQWESADSLAIDYALSGNLVESKSWYERAVVHAGSAGVECQTKSLGGLAGTHLALGDFPAATQTAHAACDLWRKHASSSPRRFPAERQLGHCILRQAESCFEADPTRAGELLSEAVAVLTTAHQELVAFGGEATEEAQSCGELLDFARRLRDSLPTAM